MIRTFSSGAITLFFLATFCVSRPIFRAVRGITRCAPQQHGTHTWRFLDMCEPKIDETGDLGRYLKCGDPFLLAEEFLLPRGKCQLHSWPVFISSGSL
jgi:hypothetical protein